jgi:predicted ATPase/SAM-dependent methyltransferase
MSKIPAETLNKYGIKNVDEIEYKDLNVIIGKNGAGKTRFLKAVRDYYRGDDYKDYEIVYAYFPDINPSYQEKIVAGSISNPDLYNYLIRAENSEFEFKNFLSYIEECGYDLLADLLHTINTKEKYETSTEFTESKTIEEDINSIIGPLLNKNIVFKNSRIYLSLKEKSANGKKKKRLLSNQLPKMSPGELSLFYLSIFIAAIKKIKKKSKIILILDEPECHLHSKALLTLVELIKSNEIFDKCWIATHSIFVLPQFDFSEIIYIEDSNIQKRNSKYYEDIYNSIVGNNEHISEFFLSRYMWQYHEFIAECFCLPQEVKKPDSNDEQLNKFLKYIQKKTLPPAKPLKILDFGGGSGRLGKFLEECPEKVVEPNYSIYDPFIKIEDRSKFTYINETDLLSLKANEKYDCIVMMNVLHEIDILKWASSFNLISKSLKDDGYLLLLEVKALSRGEHPFEETGYIFPREEQMKILFCSEEIKSVEYKYSDKSNFFVIQKVNTDFDLKTENILEALYRLGAELYKELKEEYKKKIEYAHQKKEVDFISPRKYAFLSQHYLNVMFAIERLKDSTKSPPSKDSTPPDNNPPTKVIKPFFHRNG